jgi:hypothetical protein
MTLWHVSHKIFRANLGRYLVFFLCGSFAVMILFMYCTVYTNRGLMAAVGSAGPVFYAPTLVIVVFGFLFMVYSQSVYTMYRMNELGLMMSLGMTRAQVRTTILVENGIISALSLLLGMGSGTLLSWLFHLLILWIVGIQAVPFALSLRSYLYTLLFFAAVYSLTTAGTVVVALKSRLVNLLRYDRRATRNSLSGPASAIAGTAIVVLSMMDLYLHIRQNTAAVLLRGAIGCLLGLYLSISSVTWFIAKARRARRHGRYAHVLFLANLRHSFGQTKNILFVVLLLVAVALFFANMGVLILWDIDRLAAGYNPFDIAYAELGDAAGIPVGRLDSMVRNGETRLLSQSFLEFVKTPGLVVLCDRNLNASIGSGFDVEAGRFISLAQEMLDDNYPHDDVASRHLSSIVLYGKSYVSQQELTEVLFNSVNLVESGGVRYAIVADRDYGAIREVASARGQVGRICLLRFEDWRRTRAISDRIALELGQHQTLGGGNVQGSVDVETQKWYRWLYQPSSRSTYYNERKQVAALTLFLFAFVGLLFAMTSPVMLYFKLLTGFDRERARYVQLSRVGITAREVKKLVRSELRVFFFVPFVIGTLLALSCTFALPVVVGDRARAMQGLAMAAAAYLILHGSGYLACRSIYGRKLLAAVGLSSRMG